jgi:FtsP/CotA-like multicopper oxidase with cupredoxin domain
MNERSTSYLAGGALLVAALALALAIVATVRAGNDSDASSTTSQMGGDMMGSSGMGSGMSGMEHGAEAPQQGVPNATASRGGQSLAHTVEGDTWVFRLVAKPVKWEILPGVRVTAWTYNGTVPGPEIRVPYGQRVRVVIKNELPDPTTVHWHGIAVPNAMDGVPGVTQDPIAPGESFTYEFRAVPTANSSRGGTFMYHSHFDEDRQVGLGLSAPFVIDPPAPAAIDLERTIFLGEWNLDPESGDTRPPMQMEGSFPNYFTISGKAFPATEPIKVERGKRVLLRVIGGMQFTHPMHLHGMSFKVVAKDGAPLAQPYEADVVDVAPGERYDLLFTADRPGKWVFHCHIGHHLTNNGEGPGGLLTVVQVS